MQRDLLLNAIVRIQKSCPDKTKCQDKHHITAVFFSSVSNWRKSFFLVKMHFRYAMPDVLIFFQFLCFFYFGTIFVWRLQYCAAPIHYADNFIWKLAFAFSKVGINLSDVKVLLMEKGWICKTLFHFADFTWWLREYSEHWKICWIQWKDFDWEKMEEKMIVWRHTWYSELVGVTSIFFWPGHNYTRERGGHPRYLSSAQETFGLALISGVHTGSSFKICRL